MICLIYHTKRVLLSQVCEYYKNDRLNYVGA